MKSKKETKNRLKDLRLSAGLKQSDLAKIVGCSQQTISNYETGFSTNLDSIVEETIANYFSCTIDYLRGLSSIKNPEEYINNDVTFLQKEFIKLGIIEEGEEISQEQLDLFRDLIKANKQFFKRLSSTLPKDSDNNESY
jgi:transcriptional regulator with XRE-family HTH domain